MVHFSIIKLDFIPKTAQIHGHMGLKMFHESKARKDNKYISLNVLYYLLTLRFEGVVPTRVCGFPDLTIQVFKDIGICLPADKSRRNEVETPFFGASST